VIYGVAAGGLGLAFLALVARSLVERRPAFDQRVFEGSVAYLSALFLAMLVDLAVG
jgi:heme O synthase-like polyprenyltransferase